jgi:hypothetical protein
MPHAIYRAEGMMSTPTQEVHPTDPDQTGWHLFSSKSQNGLLPMKWCAEKQGYLKDDGSVFSMAEINEDLIYQGSTFIDFDKGSRLTRDPQDFG